jgi:exopolyphosphatase / guanosine-5'-triphosphate,3'-diphosphate pyrophosphatase
MPCACVDIGTNTTRLLVAEREGERLREVAAVRRFLRILPAEDGTIPDALIREIADAVAAHVRLARHHGVTHVRTVATAAIRAAPNKDALCKAVREHAGVEVEILSGEDEAAFAFAGAIATLEALPSNGLVGVIDVGGGSSELVTGTPDGKITWWASFPVGSGALTDRHLRSDPPKLDELASARAEIDRALGGVTPPKPSTVLAVGGSATSLAAAAGGELAPETIARVLAVLIDAPATEAARTLGLPIERARLLPAGLLTLEAAWNAFGQPPLRVVQGGLREGVVLRALAGRS